MRRIALLLLILAGCTPGGGDPEPDPEPEVIACHGDPLEAGVPYSTDLDLMPARWNTNTELLRVLFVGEPQ